MMIVTGTPETRTQHSTQLAATGVVLSVGIPIAIAVLGIAEFGGEAINGMGVVVWGVVGALAMLLSMRAGRAMGMTQMNFVDLIGSMFVRPHSSRSQMLGTAIHLVDGALLAVIWAYGVQLANLPANWATGLLWGGILWMLALLLMSSVGAVHPAIRRGEQDDPGTAATNFGSMTPMGALMAHLVYGLVLGVLYQMFPLTAVA